MALTRHLNYYVDSDGHYRRIPWDTWLKDGAFFGLAPVGIKVDDNIEWDSNGNVTCNTDFLDPADSDDGNKQHSGISAIIEQTNERTFLETYENVIAFYESDESQTYELDYDKSSYKS
jgi:hypothetical protein